MSNPGGARREPYLERLAQAWHAVMRRHDFLPTPACRASVRAILRYADLTDDEKRWLVERTVALHRAELAS